MFPGTSSASRDELAWICERTKSCTSLTAWPLQERSAVIRLRCTERSCPCLLITPSSTTLHQSLPFFLMLSLLLYTAAVKTVSTSTPRMPKYDNRRSAWRRSCACISGLLSAKNSSTPKTWPRSSPTCAFASMSRPRLMLSCLSSLRFRLRFKFKGDGCLCRVGGIEENLFHGIRSNASASWKTARSTMTDCICSSRALSMRQSRNISLYVLRILKSR
mmetsp:Transcript_91988/g.148542  ORF Transcript_91988/g.148542 Transcript_91988/m.148542 type:complete len:218 (-) Transcript_91988:1673-2326(-)